MSKNLRRSPNEAPTATALSESDCSTNRKSVSGPRLKKRAEAAGSGVRCSASLVAVALSSIGSWRYR